MSLAGSTGLQLKTRAVVLSVILHTSVTLSQAVSRTTFGGSGLISGNGEGEIEIRT